MYLNYFVYFSSFLLHFCPESQVHSPKIIILDNLENTFSVSSLYLTVLKSSAFCCLLRTILHFLILQSQRHFSNKRNPQTCPTRTLSGILRTRVKSRREHRPAPNAMRLGCLPFPPVVTSVPWVSVSSALLTDPEQQLLCLLGMSHENRETSEPATFMTPIFWERSPLILVLRSRDQPKSHV